MSTLLDQVVAKREIPTTPTPTHRIQGLRQRLTLWLRRQLRRLGPSQADLIKRAIGHVSGLELTHGESIKVRALSPMYGSIKISGAGNPCFEYVLFDEPIMEFVHVNAYAHLSGRVTVKCWTADLGEIAPKPQYTEPLYQWMLKVYDYFPVMREGVRAQS